SCSRRRARKCPGDCRSKPAKCHNPYLRCRDEQCARPVKRQQEIRGREAPPSGWPSVLRSPIPQYPTESSPARGGETEPPPPRGSRRLRARARHFAAQGAARLLAARARAGRRARARGGIRPPAARGQHLGAALAGRKARHALARPARGRPAPRAPRRTRYRSVSKAAQGLVRLPVWRARLVLIVLGAGFAVLAGRAVWLQAMETDFLQEKGEARYSRVMEIAATRGRVLDRNGEALAVSTPVKSVWAIPGDVDAGDRERRKLASLLAMQKLELDKRLGDGSRDFVYLKRQIPPETAAAVQQLGLKGIHQQVEYRRYYPGGEVTAHVIGFTGVDDSGQEGIELAHQDTLGGKAGSRRVIRDRLGRIVEDVGSIHAAQDGSDFTLSIDSKIQSLAFGALKSAVERHRAKAGAVLALETGKITPRTAVDTGSGRLTMANYTIRDVHPGGTQTVAQVLAHSSNVGMAKIALSLPRESMWDFFHRVGFGTAPDLGFPGAAAGRL